MADRTGLVGEHAVRPGVAVLLADVAFEIRRLERMVSRDLPLTPALAFWALYRAETRRVNQGMPSEIEYVREAFAALVPVGVH